ncbi:MAG: hypothetical protein ABSB74_02370 [Tepidisphaeraceae bacterium]
MKLLKLAAVSIFGLAMLLSVAAPGDEPATRPAPGALESDRSGPVGNPTQFRRALRALAGRTRGVAPYSQQEWDDMMAFLKQYSPARAHVLANLNLPENAPIRLDAIRKWRNFNFIKEHFPAIADQMLRRFQLEDDLFALMLKAQANSLQLNEYRELIHNKVAQIVQLDFVERQTRIDQLQKLLESEKQAFARDQAMVQKVIDHRTDTIMARLGQFSPDDASPTTRPAGQGEFRDVANPDQPPASQNDAAPEPAVKVSRDPGDQGK